MFYAGTEKATFCWMELVDDVAIRTSTENSMSSFLVVFQVSFVCMIELEVDRGGRSEMFRQPVYSLLNRYKSKQTH